MANYISRALTVGEKTFTEEELLREGAVFVVLAEPGAGKTELLKALAGLLQTSSIKAGVFRNKPWSRGGAGSLLIDAMDEVARIDVSATDQIIANASEMAAAKVVFAGRSSEWDEGRTAYVEECFGVKPVIVRLEPFNEDEQRQLFLAEFPAEDFDAFATEVKRFEVGPLLGNPQFLQLLGDAYIESGRIFTSKAKIFADAVKRLAHEANPEIGRQKTRPPTDVIVSLGNEIFAKLLLSGASGIATVEQLADRDFPFIASLCGSDGTHLVDTRLLKPSDDTEKHEPVHRIVAEYCAAGYLVKRIEDPADRLSLDRVLAIAAPNGVTRDELRGMLGWMAALGREGLQFEAIELDPYAVLANGDPGQLTAAAKRRLLTKLEKLAEDDPMFRRSDVWRRFNVGHFFTLDILDNVKLLLSKPGSLRNLVLELLIGSEAANHLVDDLRALITCPTADSDSRALALEALLGVAEYDLATDFEELMKEASPDSLEIVARAVAKRGVATVGQAAVGGLLLKLADLYPDPNKRHRDGMSRYFIEVLVRSFGLADVGVFLDYLTAGFSCTCAPKHDYLCTCRHGRSKIIGKLLDTYFELATGGHDPVRVWSWVRSLHFRSAVSGTSSQAVRHLMLDNELRRAVQRLAVDGVTGDESSLSAVSRLYSSHTHSGVHLMEGDAAALSQHAFDEGSVDVWARLLSGHTYWNDPKVPNPVRALQRTQSRKSKEFLRAWSRLERGRRRYMQEERKAGHLRHRHKYANREAAVDERNRNHLRDNLADIEAGRHWGWLRRFAHGYLFKQDELTTLVSDPETPLRALRNCFPLVDQYVPTVEGLGRRERPDIAEVLAAACVILYRDGDTLEAIDPRILAAVKTEVSTYPTFAEGEAEAFESALDAALFTTSDAAENFLRAFLEEQLRSTETIPVHAYWLEHQPVFAHLKATLPLEWLERFPQMPLEAAQTLFGIAAAHGDRSELLSLIDRRLADRLIDSGEDTDADKLARARQKFWQLNAFFYQSPEANGAWETLKADPKTIFSLEHRLGRFSSDGDHRPPLVAEQVWQIMDAFVEVWPEVPLPLSYGTGDPDEETAYRFLLDCIWKVSEDSPEKRIPVLDRIIAANHRFATFMPAARTLRAEAMRKVALQDFRAPEPTAIGAYLDSGQVASVEDLRALMVEELNALQKWLNGSATDPLDAFYSDGKRIGENEARNRIVDRLQARMQALGLSVVIEQHMAGGNRCDITASVVLEGIGRLLVTEVKGQWNEELYTAAAMQLDARYAIHPDAAKQGVYLALWYGNGEKVAGLVDATVTSAEGLKNRIEAKMPAELKKRVDVVVLDLWRASVVPKPKAVKAKTSPKVKVTHKPKPKAS